MTYKEMMESARKNSDGRCKLCPVCDGKACAGVIPGCGARGTGDTFQNSYNVLQEIKVLPDVIYHGHECSTETEFFGHKLRLPIINAPILSVDGSWGYGKADPEYAMDLLKGCKKAGILGSTGDGPNPKTFFAVEAALKETGVGIPTFKPRTLEDAKKRIQWAEANNAAAIMVDIDMLGNSALRKMENPIHAMSMDELAAIKAMTKLPFIVRGVLTVKNSIEALQAGADAICVTNHGGRCQDGLPSAPEFLPAISDAIGGRIPILVDGAVRSGVDVFRMLALGANIVMIGRPFVHAVMGAGEDGPSILLEKIGQDLLDTMYMTNAATIDDITGDMIYWPRMGYLGK